MGLFLVTLDLRFLNASFSSSPHLNFVSMVSSRGNAVSDAYLEMNLGKYPVIPRKLFAASFDARELLLFTASIFSELGFDPFFMKRCS